MQQGKFALAQEGEGEGEIEPAELQKEVCLYSISRTGLCD